MHACMQHQKVLYVQSCSLIFFPVVLQSGGTLVELEYRRLGFNCEYLLIANCEFFYVSQLIDSLT